VPRHVGAEERLDARHVGDIVVGRPHGLAENDPSATEVERD
jgi:hypothetical protein